VEHYSENAPYSWIFFSNTYTREQVYYFNNTVVNKDITLNYFIDSKRHALVRTEFIEKYDSDRTCILYTNFDEIVIELEVNHKDVKKWPMTLFYGLSGFKYSKKEVQQVLNNVVSFAGNHGLIVNSDHYVYILNNFTKN